MFIARRIIKEKKKESECKKEEGKPRSRIGLDGGDWLEATERLERAGKWYINTVKKFY